jgi:hypothetical protein
MNWEWQLSSLAKPWTRGCNQCQGKIRKHPGIDRPYAGLVKK